MGPGAWNLALDEAIFEAVRAGASPPTLRLYRWAAPTLSIGYAQDRARDVDEEACRALGVTVLRRVTGGRAVLHNAEITYSVSAPAGLPGFGAGLDEAYCRVAAGLLAGMRLLGIPAETERAAPPPVRRAARQAGCFASAARHEITVGGRKLIGSAQRRSCGAFLQHGSILLVSHAAVLDRVLRGQPAIEGPGPMVGLADLLPRLPGPEAVTAALAGGCAAAWGAVFSAGGVSPDEERAARALVAGRYAGEDWNAGGRREPG